MLLVFSCLCRVLVGFVYGDGLVLFGRCWRILERIRAFIGR